MKLYWNTKIRDLDYYEHLPEDSVVYVKDLNHQVPLLINEAVARGYKPYPGDHQGRYTSKQKWFRARTTGTSTPKTTKFKIANATLYDYTFFDPNPDVSEEEMGEVVNTIYDNYLCCSHGVWYMPESGTAIIKQMLPNNVKNIPTTFSEIEEEYWWEYKQAMRGGANCVIDYNKIPFETHIDYHQLYASVMINNYFPVNRTLKGVDHIFAVEGYHPHKYALYIILKGQARLKPDGFALWKSNKGDFMAGADGEWFDLAEEIGTIWDVDLRTMKENFEIKDLYISETIYYTTNFNGKTAFGKTVKEIYNGRHSSDGAVKRLYKQMNEYMPGYFERTSYKGTYWTALEKPKNNRDLIQHTTRFNCVVGAHITAYGRKKLSDLLHMFPHDKVIGYDTDCVFFAGKPEEVPKEVMKLFGEGIGQLHFDGIYKDVIHNGSKNYYGYDLENNNSFVKRSGYSKTGKRWKWLRDEQIYILTGEKNEE